MSAADYHFSKKSFSDDEQCADLGYFGKKGKDLFFAIADVAGHGASAHKLSLEIEKYFAKADKTDLLDLMNGLHVFIKGSRGAVGVAGVFSPKTGIVKYVGIGNISMRIFGKKDSRLISNEGIIGYVIRTPRVERLQLAADDVLVLYTDGIRDHFDRNDCAEGLFDQESKHIVSDVMKYFNKGNDDAACIAIRHKND